jgi:hypothetical protein
MLEEGIFLYIYYLAYVSILGPYTYPICVY